VTCRRSKLASAVSELQSLSVTATPSLTVVGGGADESVEVCAGTESSPTAGGIVVATVEAVVRGGGTVGAVAGVDVGVDRIVVGSVTTVSSADVAAVDVAPEDVRPSLHAPTATASSARSATGMRAITRPIMSLGADTPAAMRENEARLVIASLAIHSGCDSTSTGQESP
jgi:hypothetical protein